MSVYWFTVPIKGEETFAVEANSLEEALERVTKGEYVSEPEIRDVDWDFDWRPAKECLSNCVCSIEENE
ncbi:putative RNA polymerase inhibitor [Acinetobacter phage BS46]|nr:putative RNA polymerase inhibitor [Acinetobacter phage BS46]